MKIILENGKEIHVQVPSGEVTIINEEDRWILTEFPTWVMSGSKSKYVVAERQIKTEYSTVRERLYLHRLIVHKDLISKRGKEQVDHKDRDRLNNRRNNLRICSIRENAANVAVREGRRFKGVHLNKTRNLKKQFSSWIAYIDAKNRGLKKRKYLGHFLTAQDAAKAYDKAAKEIWGEFAFLNFPD